MDHASLILGLVILAVLELLIIIIGSIWSIGRDMWIRTQSQIMAERLGDCTEALEKISLFNERITEKLKSSDELTKDNRRELLDLLRENRKESQQLMLDIEKRTRECINELQYHFSGRDRGETNINFNRDAQGTQIGNSNKQNT